MNKQTLAFALAALFITPLISATSFAAVLDTDNAVVSSNAGKLKDFSVTFFSIASVANMKPNRSTTDTRSIDSYDYFSFNYKMDSVTRLSMRIPFYYNTDGTNEYGDKVSSELAMADIHFVYSNYDLGYVGDIDLSGKAKIYLPSSRRSANQRQVTQVRFEGYADYSISRSVLVAYVIKPDIYWQTQTAAINDTIPQFEDGTYVKDPRTTTQQFGLEHYLQFQWDINSVFSLATKTGFDEGWYHTSAAEGLEGSHTTTLRLGLDLWIRPTRGLSFTLGISNQTYLSSFNGGSRISFVEPFNTQYSLMTNAYVF